MMKQVNLTLSDEEYEVLVREAGKRMVVSGKWLAVTTLTYELLKPVIANINGSTPTETPNNDSEQDNEQDNEQETNPNIG